MATRIALGEKSLNVTASSFLVGISRPDSTLGSIDPAEMSVLNYFHVHLHFLDQELISYRYSSCS